MTESKLKFYIGNITEGGTDGEACTSVQCLFPLVYWPEYSTTSTNPLHRVPIKFALRCDEGYQAINVKLTFDKGIFKIGGIHNDYSNYWSDSQDINIGTVGNVNKMVRLFSGFYPDYAIKIYTSFTEVKL